MTNPTPTLSKHVLGPAIRVVMFALLLAGFGASAALAQTRGYVANNNDNTVSVIDTATHSVIATVPVGASPGGNCRYSEWTVRLPDESTGQQRLSD